MAINIEYFFFCLKRRENGECNVINFRRFLFGKNPDAQAWILLDDIITQILLTLLTIIALQILQKYQFGIDGFYLVWVIM